MPECEAAKTLYCEFMDTGNLDHILVTISSLEAIKDECHKAEQDILQEFGIGISLQCATEVTCSVDSFLSAIQELYCLAFVDVTDLQTMYSHKKLLFQSF